MGKQGPCYHCGATSTPLWRNGPPEKPVLCNACGSRWRIKGTLVNYTPIHARSKTDDFEDHRVSKVKAISLMNKEVKLLKTAHKYENAVGRSGNGMLGGSGGSQHYQSLYKGLDHEDTSNRSSSGSAISNSDSCMQLGSADVSDLTGPSQSSIVWDTTVPSRKRTCFNRPKQSCVEKLTRDLHCILHEQQSYFSGSSEENLIFESDTPMVSVEIGHGSVLIRHPNSAAREEESEASSLSVNTKTEAYSRLTSLPVYNPNKDDKFSNLGIEKSKLPMVQEQYNRDDDGKLQMLANPNSPLRKRDLKDMNPVPPFCAPNVKRSPDALLDSFPGLKSGMKITKGVFTKASHEHKEIVDNNGSAFSPRSLFGLPPASSNLTNDYLRYADESSDYDVLVDVPSNTSFPQAELLSTSSFAGSSSTHQSLVKR